MGTKSFIVRGRGNELSYNSCSHGAGRRMSRGQARREIPIEAFSEAMQGRVWQRGSAQALVDEAPQAYKDVDHVMRDQEDWVEVVYQLNQVMCVKGG